MQTAAKTMFAAFEILAEENRELPGKEIIERIQFGANGDQLPATSILAYRDTGMRKRESRRTVF